MVRSTIFSTCLAITPLVWGQAPPRVVAVAPSSSYLGVGVIDVNEGSARRVGLAQPLGVEVAAVAEGSPAAKAGLQRMDVVTRLRGETVQGVEHFVRLVRETPVGREVEMEVVSAGGVRTVKATIGERSPAFARMPARDVRLHISEPVDVDIPRPTMLVNSRSLGATLESIDGQFAQVFGASEGVLVREVEADGVAARAGLQPGDLITSIEGSPMRRTSDIRMELSRSASDKAQIEVLRGKARRRLEIETGRTALTRPLQGVRQVSQPR